MQGQTFKIEEEEIWDKSIMTNLMKHKSYAKLLNLWKFLFRFTDNTITIIPNSTTKTTSFQMHKKIQFPFSFRLSFTEHLADVNATFRQTLLKLPSSVVNSLLWN